MTPLGKKRAETQHRLEADLYRAVLAASGKVVEFNHAHAASVTWSKEYIVGQVRKVLKDHWRVSPRRAA